MRHNLIHIYNFICFRIDNKTCKNMWMCFIQYFLNGFFVDKGEKNVGMVQNHLHYF